MALAICFSIKLVVMWCFALKLSAAIFGGLSLGGEIVLILVRLRHDIGLLYTATTLRVTPGNWRFIGVGLNYYVKDWLG